MSNYAIVRIFDKGENYKPFKYRYYFDKIKNFGKIVQIKNI